MLASLHAFLASPDSAATIAMVSAYGYWLVFFGTFFTGEVAIISSFVLAGQGSLSVSYVFLLTVAATILADAFWYAVGRFSLVVFKQPEVIDLPANASGLSHTIHVMVHRYLWQLLLVSKFIFGARLIILLYTARAEGNWPKIALFDLAGISIFIAVLAAIGYSSGKGVSTLGTGHPLIASAGVVLLLLLIIFGIEQVVRKRLTKRFSELSHEPLQSAL